MAESRPTSYVGAVDATHYVNYAGASAAEKRGDITPFTLDEARLELQQQKFADLSALDEVLERLTKIDAHKSRVVEMRFFGGFRGTKSRSV